MTMRERSVSQDTLPIVRKMIVILWGEQNFHNLVSRTARRSKYQGNKERPLPTLGQTPCALFLIPVTAITTGLEDHSWLTDSFQGQGWIVCSIGSVPMSYHSYCFKYHLWIKRMKTSNWHIPGYWNILGLFPFSPSVKWDHC